MSPGLRPGLFVYVGTAAIGCPAGRSPVVEKHKESLAASLCDLMDECIDLLGR